MPKIPLTSLHTSLHRLTGEWRGEERIAPSPWDPTGATAQAVVRNRVALDGLTLIQEYEQSRGGIVVFQGHGVFWVDGEEIALRWWDNWSPVPREFRGSFDEDRLVLVSRDPKGPARATWTVIPGAYRYTLEVSQDGAAWHRYMEAEYRKS